MRIKEKKAEKNLDGNKIMDRLAQLSDTNDSINKLLFFISDATVRTFRSYAKAKINVNFFEIFLQGFEKP